MARRTQTITITNEGRDKGKTFVLTEMPADQAERWATRLLLALTNNKAELPPGALDSGMAGIAAAGIKALAKLPYEEAEPLLEEMFAFVQYQHAPNMPLQSIFPGPSSQIEEVKTRLDLRLALFKLHVNFSEPVATPPTAEAAKGPSAA